MALQVRNCSLGPPVTSLVLPRFSTALHNNPHGTLVPSPTLTMPSLLVADALGGGKGSFDEKEGAMEIGAVAETVPEVTPNPRKEEREPINIEPPPAYRGEFTPTVSHATQEYLNQLISDKNEIRCAPASFRHVGRLIDMEIQRVVTTLSESFAAATTLSSIQKDGDNEELGGKVVLQEKINVPVDKYPRYNFVGRILGPRGMTAKQLEEETGCKIMVRGRGSCRTEPLHVVIHCEDYPDKVEAKMAKAVERINDLLSPPPEGKDELKRKQLIELSIINGTYRPTNATKLALQSPRLTPSPYSPSTAAAVTGSSGAFGNIPRDLLSFLAGGEAKRLLMSSMHPQSTEAGASSPHSPPTTPRPSTPSYSHGVTSSLSPGLPPLLDDQQAYLAALIGAQQTPAAAALAGSQLAAEYYRQLFTSLADPSLFPSVYSSPPTASSAPTDLFSSFSSLSPSNPSPLSAPPPGLHLPSHSSMAAAYSAHPSQHGHHSGSGVIPQVNYQQYLAAAAMLNSPPFTGSGRHDGSGDHMHGNGGKRA